jgi:PAS domain S-box-containing protein
MFEFFRALFGTDFMPHLYCLRSDPAVLWLQVVSDLAIAAACFAIPVVLFQVVLRRKEVLFRKVAVLFVLFIAACGTTHLLDVWTVWHPMYRLGGVVKALTAVFSIVTAVVLLKLRPDILTVPSAGELQAEIEQRRRAEADALAEQERVRWIAESVQDHGLFMIDGHGVVTTWNSGAERLKGYTAEEIVGKNFSCFYTGEDVVSGKPEEAIRTALEMGQFEDQGWRMRKDGSRFWAQVVMRPVWDGDGSLRGFSKITHDLTQSRNMEMRYQTLLEAAPDAIIIVNRQGRIEFANSQMERLFGFTRLEIHGKSVDSLVPVRFRGTHGGYRHGFFDSPANREMGAGRELLGLRKDGTEFSVEISLSPLETRSGPVALAAVRDVSERKKAETRFRALLESAPDAMVIVNSDGFIELANTRTERLFGYSRLELVGQSVDVLVPQDLRGGHFAHRDRFFADPRPREMGAGFDLMAVRKDGTQFPVEISLSPLEGPGEISVTAAIRDVGERKRSEQQLSEKMTELRQSNEALEQFAHIASHDLQEPLRMVASYTQLLSKRYKGRLDADADEFIAYAVDGTQRMKRLIEDLLVYSRAGRSAPAAKELDSEDALREALGNLQAAIEESEAQVTWNALPKVTAAELQLVQLFQNLVGNAIKYRGARVPRILVAARNTATEWIFSVADNGIGIEAKYFDRVFVIFQRLHGRGEYEGTGIGLAICKRILQQQGGRIWVESEFGTGSTFYFALPVR